MSKEKVVEAVMKVKDVLREYDLAGSVFISNGDDTGCLRVLDPSWSALLINDETSTLTMRTGPGEYENEEELEKSVKATGLMLCKTILELENNKKELSGIYEDLKTNFNATEVSKENKDNG